MEYVTFRKDIVTIEQFRGEPKDKNKDEERSEKHYNWYTNIEIKRLKR